ncbi:MAG TPA: hypothetical protein VJ044_01975 [Candidatus Hodarchaeales archaeon]|nr:hypothetical protein [Candidatus Hodarchaeales archaeon]
MYVSVSAFDRKTNTGIEIRSGTRLHSTPPPSSSNKRTKTKKLLFYLILPPYRNYSSRDITNLVRAEKSLLDKCHKGASYALECGLNFWISPEIAQTLLSERGFHPSSSLDITVA